MGAGRTDRFRRADARVHAVCLSIIQRVLSYVQLPQLVFGETIFFVGVVGGSQSAPVRL